MHRFPRLHEALDYATEAHSGQLRKGTPNPYLGHLIGVCSLVLDYGGDEDQAIAGLLHDVIEDCGLEHADRLRALFGPRVADIVQGCTDGAPDEAGEKAAWQERKEAYLAHLAEANPDVLLVSACDKLHHARSIVADVRALAPDVFSRFKAGREGTLWYYGRLAEIFVESLGDRHPLVLELGATVGEMAVQEA